MPLEKYQFGQLIKLDNYYDRNTFWMKQIGQATQYPYKIQVYKERVSTLSSASWINQKIAKLKSNSQFGGRWLIHEAVDVPDAQDDSLGIIYNHIDNVRTFEQILMSEQIKSKTILFYFIELLQMTALMHFNQIYHDDNLNLSNIYISNQNGKQKLFIKGFNYHKTANFLQDRLKIQALIGQLNGLFSQKDYLIQEFQWQKEEKNVSVKFCNQNNIPIFVYLNIDKMFLKIDAYDDQKDAKKKSLSSIIKKSFIFQQSDLQGKLQNFNIKTLYFYLLQGNKKVRVSIVNNTIKIILRHQQKEFMIMKEMGEKKVTIRQQVMELHSETISSIYQVDVTQIQQLLFPFTNIGHITCNMRNINKKEMNKQNNTEQQDQVSIGTGLYLGRNLVLTCAHIFIKFLKDQIISNRMSDGKILEAKFTLTGMQNVNKQLVKKINAKKFKEQANKMFGYKSQNKSKIEVQGDTRNISFKIVDYKFPAKYFKTGKDLNNENCLNDDYALVLLEDLQGILEAIDANPEHSINLIKEFENKQLRQEREVAIGGFFPQKQKGVDNQEKDKIGFKYAVNQFKDGDKIVGTATLQGTGRKGMSGAPILIKYSQCVWGVIGIYLGSDGTNLKGNYFNEAHLKDFQQFEKQLTHKQVQLLNRPLLDKNICTNQNIQLLDLPKKIQKAQSNPATNSIYTIKKLRQYRQAFKNCGEKNQRAVMKSKNLEINDKNMNMFAFFKIIVQSYDYYSPEIMCNNTRATGFFAFYLWISMIIFRVLDKEFRFPQKKMMEVQKFTSKWKSNFITIHDEARQQVKQKWMHFYDELREVVGYCEWDPITEILMKALLELCKQARCKFEKHSFGMDFADLFELALKSFRVLDYFQLIDHMYSLRIHDAISMIPCSFQLMKLWSRETFMELYIKGIKYLDNFKPQGPKTKSLVYSFQNINSYFRQGQDPKEQIFRNHYHDAISFFQFLVNNNLPQSMRIIMDRRASQMNENQ